MRIGLGGLLKRDLVFQERLVIIYDGLGHGGHQAWQVEFLLDSGLEFQPLVFQHDLRFHQAFRLDDLPGLEVQLARLKNLGVFRIPQWNSKFAGYDRSMAVDRAGVVFQSRAGNVVAAYQSVQRIFDYLAVGLNSLSLVRLDPSEFGKVC